MEFPKKPEPASFNLGSGSRWTAIGVGMTGNLSPARTGEPPPRNRPPDATEPWIVLVLRRFEGPLTLYAARITRDLERARDVVQEAFLRLLKEDRQTIEPHLAEWLYTVCRNQALDVRRKESRMASLSYDAAGSGSAASAEQMLEQKETASRALRFLGHLPENQQEAIRLKIQHGLSYKEISAVTGLSVSNVGFLIHTGLKTLRDRLEI